MPKRVANIMILCEDLEHRNLVYRYLLKAGQNERSVRLVPLPGNRQAGSQYVREQFPKQVRECRGVLGRRASCILIVVTDADNLTPVQRENTLLGELGDPIEPNEPIILLIPKWNVETWVKCALGYAMLEDDRDSDRPPVNADQVKAAAHTIFDWARPAAQVEDKCVPSLTAALPRWRRIG